MAKLACYRHDVNAGLPDGPQAGLAAMNTTASAGAPIHFSLSRSRQEQSFLSGISVQRLLTMIEKVRGAHALAASPVVPSVASPESVVASTTVQVAAGEGAVGIKTSKHRTQNLAIVRALEQQGLLAKAGVYIEFGAGKGLLSSVVSEATPSASFVLLDWSKPQAAADKEMAERGINCARYKLDLRHLWLRGIPEVWPISPPSAFRRSAIGKHLCGAATDFSLRSVVDALQTKGLHDEIARGEGGGGGGDGALGGVAAVDGVTIATCCHHKCSWASYTNRNFLEGLGFNEDDFRHSPPPPPPPHTHTHTHTHT